MADWLIDHLFVFVEAAASETAMLSELGLVESFRRPHPGQGTTNVCFCFDNAYLELLWIADAAEAASCELARSGLAERAAWRRSGASPFGVALRSVDPTASLPFPSWDYRAPFLPPDMAIPVARASDDPRQPLLFRSPGSTRPDQWTDGRAGARQSASGFAEITEVRLAFADAVAADPAFETLAAAGVITLACGGASQSMELALSRRDGRAPRRLRLPDMILS